MVDQLAPNLLTVDAQGNIGASFTGKVNAQGLDLPNGNGASPLPTSRVRWVPDSGGVVAEIFGFLNANGTQSLSLDVDPDGGNLALIQLNAKAAGALGSAGIGIAALDSSGGTASKTLVDSAGNSHFVQLDTASPSRFWSGAVNGGGGVRLGGTGNWTVTRTAAGTYTLALNNGVNGVWAIATAQINEAGGSQPAIDVDYISLVGRTTTLTVKTVSDPFGLTDLNWSFSAIATNN